MHPGDVEIECQTRALPLLAGYAPLPVFERFSRWNRALHVALIPDLKKALIMTTTQSLVAPFRRLQEMGTGNALFDWRFR